MIPPQKFHRWPLGTVKVPKHGNWHQVSPLCQVDTHLLDPGKILNTKGKAVDNTAKLSQKVLVSF